MASKHITLLKNLDVKKVDYTIKVNIIKLWKLDDFSVPGETYSIEMILLDEEGDRIQASVWKDWVLNFQSLLTEYQCVFIRKPNLGKNKSKFKLINRPEKLFLNNSSIVSPCTDFTGTKHGFKFISFRDIISNKSLQSASIDVIFDVVRPFQLQPVTKKNGDEAVMMNAEVSDESGEKLQLTLWDNYAHELDTYIANNLDARHVVIILQFGKISVYEGARPSISNCYLNSRMFINSDVSEISAYKQSKFGDSTKQASSSTQTVCSSFSYSLHDAFLNPNDCKLIIRLSEIKVITSVVIVGIIMGFCEEDGWYYIGCNRCSKKVESTVISTGDADGNAKGIEERKYFCDGQNCIGKEITPIPKFRIHMRVQDSTGVCTLTLFDRDATRLLHKKATDFFNSSLEVISDEPYPAVITTLLDRKFAFRIKISKYNVDNGLPGYAISKLTEDVKVIEAVENMTNDVQTMESEPLNLSIPDSVSNEHVNIKDVLSETGDNVTPQSELEKSTASSPINKINKPASDFIKDGLKCNLIEIYDVDSMASGSSTKPSKKVSSEGSGKLMTTLLIPKIEKD